jgi:hypothetical protein
MKGKWPIIALLAAVTLGIVSCYHPFGYSFYPNAPRFAPTNPAGVELLRREPKRDHIRLGEVWIRPDPGMDRGYVDGLLRERTAAMGGDALVIVVDRFFREGVVHGYWGRVAPAYERRIVGVVIHYQR